MIDSGLAGEFRPYDLTVMPCIVIFVKGTPKDQINFIPAVLQGISESVIVIVEPSSADKVGGIDRIMEINYD